MSRTAESGWSEAFAGLSLDRLASFVAVADAGGFAKAAPGDPSRQSQLSRQVRELERALGVELLRREGRSVVPTRAGSRLAASVRDLGEGLREVRGLVDEAVDVRIAAGDSVLRWLLLPALAARPPSPRTKVSLVASADVLSELVAGRVQLGLLRAQPMPAGLSTKPCGAVEFALFVPRALAVPTTDIRTLLPRLPLASVSTDREPFEAFATAVGQALSPTLSCETFPQAARAVATGAFAAVLPVFAASELPPEVAWTATPPGLRVKGARLTLVARARTIETQAFARALFTSLPSHLRTRLRGA